MDIGCGALSLCMVRPLAFCAGGGGGGGGVEEGVFDAERRGVEGSGVE